MVPTQSVRNHSHFTRKDTALGVHWCLQPQSYWAVELGLELWSIWLPAHPLFSQTLGSITDCVFIKRPQEYFWSHMLLPTKGGAWFPSPRMWASLDDCPDENVVEVTLHDLLRPRHKVTDRASIGHLLLGRSWPPYGERAQATCRRSGWQPVPTAHKQANELSVISAPSLWGFQLRQQILWCRDEPSPLCPVHNPDPPKPRDVFLSH